VTRFFSNQGCIFVRVNGKNTKKEEGNCYYMQGAMKKRPEAEELVGLLSEECHSLEDVHRLLKDLLKNRS